MLVLSRRQKEKIVFPNLGITVELLRSNGKVAQLGIDAPSTVKVLREEVYEKLVDRFSPAEPASAMNAHDLRNQLNSLGLTLQVIQKRLLRGEIDGVDAVLGSVIDQLRALDGGARPQVDADDDVVRPLVNVSNKSRSALLVDDSINERTLLAELLQQDGFDVYVVPDGRQALEFLRGSHQMPDFVLLDMCMPEMGGVETIAEIRSDPELHDAPFKLFAVSGADRDALHVDIGPGGVDQWFSKPVDARALLREMSAPASCA